MRLLAGLAAVSERDLDGGLLPAFVPRPRETAVSRRCAPESPLASLELAPRSGLYPLDLVVGVLLALRAVLFNDLWHLHANQWPRMGKSHQCVTYI